MEKCPFHFFYYYSPSLYKVYDFIIHHINLIIIIINSIFLHHLFILICINVIVNNNIYKNIYY